MPKLAEFVSEIQLHAAPFGLEGLTCTASMVRTARPDQTSDLEKKRHVTSDPCDQTMTSSPTSHLKSPETIEETCFSIFSALSALSMFPPKHNEPQPKLPKRLQDLRPPE